VEAGMIEGIATGHIVGVLLRQLLHKPAIRLSLCVRRSGRQKQYRGIQDRKQFHQSSAK
jgi:hypothetical protein